MQLDPAAFEIAAIPGCELAADRDRDRCDLSIKLRDRTTCSATRSGDVRVRARRISVERKHPTREVGIKDRSCHLEESIAALALRQRL